MDAKAQAKDWLVQQAAEAFRANTGLALTAQSLPAEPGSEPGWQRLFGPGPGEMPRAFQAALQQSNAPGVLVFSRVSEPVATHEPLQALGELA